MGKSDTQQLQQARRRLHKAQTMSFMTMTHHQWKGIFDLTPGLFIVHEEKGRERLQTQRLSLKSPRQFKRSPHSAWPPSSRAALHPSRSPATLPQTAASGAPHAINRHSPLVREITASLARTKFRWAGAIFPNEPV